MPVEEQVISIYTGTNGLLDDLPVEDVQRFEAELLDALKTRHAGLLDEIRTTGSLPEDQVKAAVENFKATFQVSVDTQESDSEV
jgi:F-type H+-transporting ATPase subunit alpha